MDFPHLVYARLLRVLRSPAAHFVAIGAALYLAAGTSAVDGGTPRLVIARQQIENATERFRQVEGRAPTPEEERALTERLIDREVLFQYGVQMRLLEQPVVRRRLAAIAQFVSRDPNEARTVDERADEAIALGLHHDDLVVRRILIDGARRLIRAPWLVRNPGDQALRGYLRAHPEVFEVPAEVRITQVAVNRLKHGAVTEERAAALAATLRQGAYAPKDGARLGDELPVPASLPSLPDHEIERKLGHRFASALRDAPVGEWVGPIPSRYGLHMVWVHERRPPHLPTLAEVRERVRQRVVQKIADEWLTLRLTQLRSGFDIVVSEATS